VDIPSSSRRERWRTFVVIYLAFELLPCFAAQMLLFFVSLHIVPAAEFTCTKWTFRFLLRYTIGWIHSKARMKDPNMSIHGLIISKVSITCNRILLVSFTRDVRIVFLLNVFAIEVAS
jgi:hypothetical protein